MRITGKKIQNKVEKVVFCENYMKFVVVLETLNMKETQLTYYNNIAEDK